MLSNYLAGGLPLGAAQAALAGILALALIWLVRAWGIHLESEGLVAVGRAIVQVVAAGSILLLVLQGPLWLSGLALVVMILAAASIAGRRAQDIPAAWSVALPAIAAGAGPTILLMTWLGAIEPVASSLVPVGSMIIASAMTVASVTLNRFRAEITGHVGLIEAGLALGAAPEALVVPYVQEAVLAGLIPRLDSLRSLGIVWIPGLMTGMLISGADPLYAAVYQFAVLAMILAASVITAVAATLLIRGRAFSPAQQLILRPKGEAT